jgi:LysM repeat protein
MATSEQTTHTFFASFLKVIVLGVFLSAGFLLLTPSETHAQDRRTHVVAQGETLFSISQRYNVTVEEIRQWNRLQDNQISIGQRLVVSNGANARPDAPSPPVEPANARRTENVNHVVRSGETLFSISRRYGVTVNDIRSWNGLTSNLLEIGQVLEIRKSTQNVDERTAQRPREQAPVAEVETPEVVDTGTAVRSGAVTSAYYTVRPGDTLGRIASSNNLTVQELKSLNRMQSDRIAVGQTLLVRRPQGLPSVNNANVGTTPQGRFVNYEVQRNERLPEILRKFEMTEAELKALNADVNIAEIRQGQTISVLLPPDITYANPYRQTDENDGIDVETVRVSRYNDVDRGRSTTSGDLYNPGAYTAAHNRLPLGSVVYVENPSNNKGMFVLINDRTVEPGLKLSHAAFDLLGYIGGGNNNAIVRESNN